MATDAATIEFLLDQLGRRGASFTTKRMFGEYCLYRDLLPVAFVCGDVLFVKDTAAGRQAIAHVTTPAFGAPYPGAKLYLRLDPDCWDDGDWLRQVLDATAADLPATKPKPRKKPANASTVAVAKPKARKTTPADASAKPAAKRPSKRGKSSPDAAGRPPAPRAGRRK